MGVSVANSSLLTPADPQPVELVNADSAVPVLLLCEHAGNAVPEALDGLGVSDEVLNSHRGWDIGAEHMARQLADILGAPLILQRYSRLVIDANRRFAEARPDVPLHLGVTEAGTLLAGTAISICAMSVLLSEGIGDTVRISLADDPVHEVTAAYHMLQSLGLRDGYARVVACPTCGRVEVDVDRSILERYVGTYEITSEFVFTVSLEEVGLTVQLTGQPTFRIYPESETEFFLKIVDAQITFVVEDGEVQALILHQNGINQRARRTN